MSVITAVTAQEHQGVVDIREMDEEIVEKQINYLFADTKIDVKIGMVSNSGLIRVIADCLKKNRGLKILLLTRSWFLRAAIIYFKTGGQGPAGENAFLPFATLLLRPNIYEAAFANGRKA